MIRGRLYIKILQSIMNRVQLFCFSFAGGSASFFDEIEADLPDVEWVKLEYSGHGTRYREPLYRDFSELAQDLYEKILLQYNDGIYALFGYSMGTISLIEVLNLILKNNQLPLPYRVFLAAHEPHTKTELAGYQSDELDEWVKQRTIQFGGVPEVLIDNKAYWRLYLPLYRADYSMIGKYQFEGLRLESSIPATIFYSEKDTPTKDISLWKKHFVGECELINYSGTHFFIKDHHQEMAEVIKSKLGV